MEYFQYYGPKVAKTTNSKHGDWERVLTELLELVVPRPRRAQIVQFYCNMYWGSRIDAQFQIDWAAHAARLRSEGKDVPALPGVDEKMITAKACWEKETDEFKASVEQERDTVHAEELEEWKRVLGHKKAEGSKYEW